VGGTSADGDGRRPHSVGTGVAQAHASSTGGGTCASVQLLGNAGFESGTTTWTATSGVITNDTAETSTSTAYDKLTVTARSATLATCSNLNKATGYVRKTFDLSSYAGSTVALKFSGVEDTSLQTSFVVDDTAVTTG
jgi:hypothetical protein